MVKPQAKKGIGDFIRETNAEMYALN